MHVHLKLHLNRMGRRAQTSLNESEEKLNAVPQYLMLMSQLTFIHKSALFSNLGFIYSHNVRDLDVQNQT